MGRDDPSVTWRHVDLFSRVPVERALEGSDYAIYLVHSRAPSSRLDQAAAEDMDLLLADNFARAASLAGVRQILYLGPPVPPEIKDPASLERRTEVAQTLAAHDTPLTCLRAGLIMSPSSNAVRMLRNILRRFPITPVPGAAGGPKQPIALVDVVRALIFCLGNQQTYGRTFRIGGPQVVDMEHILGIVAAAAGVRPRFRHFPVRSSRIWYLWWRLLNLDMHPSLVRFLANHLAHTMIAGDNPVQRHIAHGATPCGEAMQPASETDLRAWRRNPRAMIRHHDDAVIRGERRARSIQRIRLPAGRDATWVAEHYLDWLPRFVWPFVACQFREDGSCTISSRWPRLKLIELSFRPTHSSAERRMYFISGGLLARGHEGPQPRLEFRDVLRQRYTMAAIHDFAPSLPWGFYQISQATVHLIVMRAFQRHMARLAKRIESRGASGHAG